MRNPNGPTAKIVARALSQPGGIIRWLEAEQEYLQASAAARRWKFRRSYYYHTAMGQIFRRHFVKVEGINGYYVHKSMLEGED